MARKKGKINVSTHSKQKSVISERFIRTLKNNVYKDMTSISKDVYIDKQGEIVNKQNNRCHRTVKMESVGVKLNTKFNSSIEVNDKDPEFKSVDNIRIS